MKRLMDLIIAVPLAVILTPVMALIAVGVWIDVTTPILFRQVRPGLHGKPFTLLKFRTMSAATSPWGDRQPDEQRLTRFGRWLRASSLDELPELWNVIWGDMSMVGPRPLLVQYLPLYSAEQMRRHHVRPGLTGWAQVNGRNALTWDEKFDLDLWYVDHASIWLDLQILLRTVASVLKREGIAYSESATMPEFTGSADAGSPRPENRGGN